MKTVRSPNYSSREGAGPRMIVLHYTADAGGAVDWFRDPRSRASAHFVLARDGSVVQMVDLDETAWHAGDYKINRESVGIEVVNWGELTWADRGYRTWTGVYLRPDEVVASGGYFWQRYTDGQIEAIFTLLDFVSVVSGIPLRFFFDGQPGMFGSERPIPLWLPAGLRCAPWRFEVGSGVFGHCHLSRGKVDPGPHLPWEMLLTG